MLNLHVYWNRLLSQRAFSRKTIWLNGWWTAVSSKSRSDKRNKESLIYFAEGDSKRQKRTLIQLLLNPWILTNRSLKGLRNVRSKDCFTGVSCRSAITCYRVIWALWSREPTWCLLSQTASGVSSRQDLGKLWLAIAKANLFVPSFRAICRAAIVRTSLSLAVKFAACSKQSTTPR